MTNTLCIDFWNFSWNQVANPYTCLLHSKIQHFSSKIDRSWDFVVDTFSLFSVCFIFWVKNTESEVPKAFYNTCLVSAPSPILLCSCSNFNYWSQNSYATSTCLNFNRWPWNLPLSEDEGYYVRNTSTFSLSSLPSPKKGKTCTHTLSLYFASALARKRIICLWL